MRYANWRKGVQAIKPVPLPINRAPGDTSEPPKIGLKAFTGDQQLRVLQEARAMAIQRGVAEPKPEEPIYNFAEAVHTVLYGTVDVDDHSVQFFADAEELLNAPDVGPDTILMLAEQHKIWQEEVSPQIGKMEASDYRRFTEEIAGPEGEPFFAGLRPSIRWLWARTTALQLLTSPIFKFLSGASAPDTSSPESSNNSQQPSATT